MGTSGTETCGGCLKSQFKHFPSQLALKLNLAKLSQDTSINLFFRLNRLVCSISPGG